MTFITLAESKSWMGIALEEARIAGKDIPVGCLVIKTGEVLGRAHNQKEETNDPTAHAEIVAIRQAANQLASWRLNDCILVTTLEPCPMCAEAIIQARISILVFGAYDEKSGACGSRFNLFQNKRIYPLPEIIGGIEEEGCAILLEEYFRAQVRKKEK